MSSITFVHYIETKTKIFFFDKIINYIPSLSTNTKTSQEEDPPSANQNSANQNSANQKSANKKSINEKEAICKLDGKKWILENLGEITKEIDIKTEQVKS